MMARHGKEIGVIPPQLEARFRVLLDNLALSPVPAPSAGSAEHNADLQAAATAQVDALLSRIAALSVDLRRREDSAEWDALDQLIARVLLGDVAMVAGGWRALGAAAGARLDRALEELQAAGRDADRVLKDIPHS